MSVDLDAPDKKVTKKASVELKSHSDATGKAEFTEYDVDGWKYVRIVLDVAGLEPGKHAVHIHEKSDCDCEDFKCAGGHFDPGPAGNTDPDANHGFHAGDLPNIIVGDDGKGHLETITTRVTLSDGPVSILQPEEGTSLMVHAKEDPYGPGESGSGYSGGPRLLCGAIQAS